MSLKLSGDTLIQVIKEGSKVYIAENLDTKFDFNSLEFFDDGNNTPIWNNISVEVPLLLEPGITDKEIIEMKDKINSLENLVGHLESEVSLRNEFMAYKGISFNRDYKLGKQ